MTDHIHLLHQDAGMEEAKPDVQEQGSELFHVPVTPLDTSTLWPLPGSQELGSFGHKGMEEGSSLRPPASKQWKYNNIYEHVTQTGSHNVADGFQLGIVLTLPPKYWGLRLYHGTSSATLILDREVLITKNKKN